MAEVLRDSGPRLLARKALAALLLQRLVVFEARLDAPRRPIRPGLVLHLGVLGACEQADQVCVPGADPAQVCRRLDAGDRCHVARVDGEIVAVRWVAFRDVQVTHAGLMLVLAGTDAYLYGAYTAPSWRRQGIAQALTADILDRLESEGYRRALSAWLPENGDARSLHPSRGRPLAVLGVVRVGPWQRQLEPRPPAARSRFRRR